MIKTIFLIFYLAFAIDKNAAAEKQLFESSQQLCDGFYSYFLKENAAAKKLGTEERNVLINSCMTRNYASSAACAKSFFSKGAALKKKSNAKDVPEKIKSVLQPELQKCLTVSNQKSQEELSALGKLYLSGNKAQVKAKLDAWAQEKK